MLLCLGQRGGGGGGLSTLGHQGESVVCSLDTADNMTLQTTKMRCWPEKPGSKEMGKLRAHPLCSVW